MGKIVKERVFCKAGTQGVNITTNFKHKLQSLYKKNVKKAIDMEIVEASKRIKLMFLPTTYCKIGGNTDAINRHINITRSSAVSSMMAGDSILSVSNKVERTIHRFTEGEDALSFFKIYMQPKINCLYTPNNDVFCHFLSALKDNIVRATVFSCIDSLSCCDGKQVRVYLDEINPSTGKLLAVVRIAVNDRSNKGIDLGLDLLGMVKSTSLISTMTNTSKNMCLESVNYRIRTDNILVDTNDVECESAEEYKRRVDSGLPFVATKSKRTLFIDTDRERTDKIVVDFAIDLPAVNVVDKNNYSDLIKADGQMQPLLRYLL